MNEGRAKLPTDPKPNPNTLSKIDKAAITFIVTTTIVLFVITLTSCATSGYGCKGTGKLITRVRQ
jgi:hypothetical protein